MAFPFIRRFLSINRSFPDKQPVEVILLSKNDPDTGLRVYKSIEHYGLDVSRSAFLNGKSPFKYIPAFNASLFLSANPEDVRRAMDAGYPAGTVLSTEPDDDPEDRELRIAFDFDGVIADDESEKVFQKTKETDGLKKYREFETARAAISLNPGPLKEFFIKLADLRNMETELCEKDRNYQRIVRTAIITARSSQVMERCVNTLREWGVTVDETFFMGGNDKQRVLEFMKPHIYFDDQRVNLEPAAGKVPLVHIPFGIANS